MDIRSVAGWRGSGLVRSNGGAATARNNEVDEPGKVRTRLGNIVRQYLDREPVALRHPVVSVPNDDRRGKASGFCCPLRGLRCELDHGGGGRFLGSLLLESICHAAASGARLVWGCAAGRSALFWTRRARQAWRNSRIRVVDVGPADEVPSRNRELVDLPRVDVVPLGCIYDLLLLGLLFLLYRDRMVRVVRIWHGRQYRKAHESRERTLGVGLPSTVRLVEQVPRSVELREGVVHHRPREHWGQMVTRAKDKLDFLSAFVGDAALGVNSNATLRGRCGGSGKHLGVQWLDRSRIEHRRIHIVEEVVVVVVVVRRARQSGRHLDGGGRKLLDDGRKCRVVDFFKLEGVVVRCADGWRRYNESGLGSTNRQLAPRLLLLSASPLLGLECGGIDEDVIRLVGNVLRGVLVLCDGSSGLLTVSNDS